MTYKNKKYAWVNEKTVDGITYAIYRCDTDPSKCLLLTGDTVTDENFDIKNWSSI